MQHVLVFVLLLKSTDTLRFCFSISFAEKVSLVHIVFNVVLLKTKKCWQRYMYKEIKKIGNENIILGPAVYL